MHGILKMLSGRGEKENRAKHKAFRDAIPDTYPYDMSIEERASQHPAYSGDSAWTLDGFNYRAANDAHGPKSKAEHTADARRIALMEEYERQVKQAGRANPVLSFGEWLLENFSLQE